MIRQRDQSLISRGPKASVVKRLRQALSAFWSTIPMERSSCSTPGLSKLRDMPQARSPISLLDPPDLPQRGVPQDHSFRAAPRGSPGDYAGPGGHDHPPGQPDGHVPVHLGAPESGLAIVFIQPVDPCARGNRPATVPLPHSPLPTLLWIRQAEDFILVSYNAAARELLGHQLAIAGPTPHRTFWFLPEFFEYMRRCLTDKKTLHTEFRTTPAPVIPPLFNSPSFAQPLTL